MSAIFFFIFKEIYKYLKIAYDTNKKSVNKADKIAGWSSLVARQAHNLKVLGSNPSPATIYQKFFIKNETACD
jgi:hypothetical protein